MICQVQEIKVLSCIWTNTDSNFPALTGGKSNAASSPQSKGAKFWICFFLKTLQTILQEEYFYAFGSFGNLNLSEIRINFQDYFGKKCFYQWFFIYKSKYVIISSSQRPWNIHSYFASYIRYSPTNEFRVIGCDFNIFHIIGPGPLVMIRCSSEVDQMCSAIRLSEFT